jgi:hypothetical protein
LRLAIDLRSGAHKDAAAGKRSGIARRDQLLNGVIGKSGKNIGSVVRFISDISKAAYGLGCFNH